MEFLQKTFDELTNRELYEILRAREAVFVVEQHCPYYDIDGLDYPSLHMFYKDDDGAVQACLRIFEKVDEPGTMQIGRVVTVARGVGLGGKILHRTVQWVRDNTEAKGIYLEAQQYAIGYYGKEGFKVTSDPFLEDGIPHVQMRLKLK